MIMPKKEYGLLEKLSYAVADALGLTAFRQNQSLLAREGVEYTHETHAKLVTRLVDEYDEKPATLPHLLADIDDAIYAVQLTDDHSLQHFNAQRKMNARRDRMQVYLDVLNDITKNDLYVDIRERSIDGIPHLERIFENRRAHMRITR